MQHLRGTDNGIWFVALAPAVDERLGAWAAIVPDPTLTTIELKTPLRAQ